MIPQVTAAALVSENKQRAYPGQRRLRSRPPPIRKTTSPWRRTVRGACCEMAENLAGSSRIELLAAAQGCDFHAPLCSSPMLERVRTRLRLDVPTLSDDRYLHPDIQAALALVRSGTLLEAADVVLPGVEQVG